MTLFFELKQAVGNPTACFPIITQKGIHAMNMDAFSFSIISMTQFLNPPSRINHQLADQAPKLSRHGALFYRFLF